MLTPNTTYIHTPLQPEEAPSVPRGGTVTGTGTGTGTGGFSIPSFVWDGPILQNTNATSRGPQYYVPIDIVITFIQLSLRDSAGESAGTVSLSLNRTQFSTASVFSLYSDGFAAYKSYPGLSLKVFGGTFLSADLYLTPEGFRPVSFVAQFITV